MLFSTSLVFFAKTIGAGSVLREMHTNSFFLCYPAATQKQSADNYLKVQIA
jgi:hypothetical protein